MISFRSLRHELVRFYHGTIGSNRSVVSKCYCENDPEIAQKGADVQTFNRDPTDRTETWNINRADELCPRLIWLVFLSNDGLVKVDLSRHKIGTPTGMSSYETILAKTTKCFYYRDNGVTDLKNS